VNNEPSAHVKVGLPEIYKAVTDTRDRVIIIEEKIDALAADSEDHESRIRSLERKVWGAAGIGVGGGAALAELISRVLGS